MLAHAICKRLAAVRRSGELPFLRPDGKSQVTVEYEDGRPIRVHTVVCSAQHDPDVSDRRLRAEILEKVVKKAIRRGGSPAGRSST